MILYMRLCQISREGFSFPIYTIYSAFLIFFCLKQLFGPEFWVGSGSFTGYNDRYSHETSCDTVNLTPWVKVKLMGCYFTCSYKYHAGYVILCGFL